jgi:hypothetical protein
LITFLKESSKKLLPEGGCDGNLEKSPQETTFEEKQAGARETE